MAGCPQCGKHWPDDYQRCPDDGTSLSPSAHRITFAATGGPEPALAPRNDEDLPPGSPAGEYRIEKKIGEGGMGSVYGARHPVIGKRAAIKVIRRELSTSHEAVDRFVLEAQSVNQIGHPNIVDVFGFGQLSDGRSFFVMEWLEGESLRDRLHRPLPFPEALEILEQIAKALQAAHDAGVVHRDLKPDNVYLHARKGDKRSVKLLDFGLAKLTGTTDAVRFDRTRTGIVMGTPLYLSPEQAKGAKIDTATDIYSLGAMAYEMFSGVVPFKADSAVEIMAMHISATANPLINLAPWIPPDVNRLVLAMLEKDPRKRPTTAQVREELARVHAAAAGRVTPFPVVQPMPYGQRTTPSDAEHTPSPQAAPTPYQPPITPVSGVPYSQQPTPPTPQVSPYATPGATIAPRGGGSKRALLIGGLAVAVLAIAGTAFVIFSKKTQPAANESTEQVAIGSNPAPPPESVGSAPQVATAPAGSAAGSAEITKPDETKPETTKPDETKPDETKPDDTKPDTTKPDMTKPDETKPSPGKPVTVKPNPAKSMGRVIITFAGPPRALVFIDGKPMGREAAGKASFAVPPGEHAIRVQAKGFKPAEQKIRVGAGGNESVKLTLEKRRTVNSVEDPFAD